MTAVEATGEAQSRGNHTRLNGVNLNAVDQDDFSFVSHVQRGHTEEKRFVVDPEKKTPCSPSSVESDMDKLFSLVANTQSCRFDDQHVSVNTSVLGHHVIPESYLNEVMKVETGQKANHLNTEGSRTEVQQCSASHVSLSIGSQDHSINTHSRASSPSQNLQGPVSFNQMQKETNFNCPGLRKEKIQNSINHSTQGAGINAEDQDDFFSFLSHAQSGCIKDQRCVIDLKKKTPTSSFTTDADLDQILNLVVNSQTSRLDDQRALMSASMPGLQVVSTSHPEGLGKMHSGQKANHLSSLHHRMEDQRCSAPHILLSPGSKVPSTKGHSRPSSYSQHLKGLLSFHQSPKRSASVTPAPDNQKVQKHTSYSAQGADLDGEDQDEFFSCLSQIQGGRMEEQRCVIDPKQKSLCSSFPTDSDMDRLFSLVVNKQSSRIDDQRASMSASLPGLNVVSGSLLDGPLKINQQKTSQQGTGGRRIEEDQSSAPHILLSPGSHSSSKKSLSRSSSPNQDLRGPVSFNQAPKRSPSVTTAPDKKKVQSSTNQSAQGAKLDAEDQDEFFSLLTHVQRRCMEEQRCVIDPDKKTPRNSTLIDSDMDQFLSLVANTQRCRLDDQRVSMSTSLPGLHVTSDSHLAGEVKRETQKKPNQLAIGGPRLEEQRFSAPHILLNPVSQASSNKAHTRPTSPNQTSRGPLSLNQVPKKSTAVTSASNKEKIFMTKHNHKHPDQSVDLDAEDQDELFSLLNHAQRERMEEQRCVFDPNKKTPHSSFQTDADMDKLFNLVANTQSSRLDDQRVIMSASMPGLHVLSTNHLGELVKNETQQKANHLGIWHPRMEEQRCSAPHILQTPGSQAPSMNAHSTSSSPSRNLQGPLSFNNAPKRTTYMCPSPNNEKIQNSKNHSAQGVQSDAEDQDQFFSFLSHIQGGRMEEQRCVFDPSKKNHKTTAPSDSDMDQLLNLVANSQSCRLDDQRVSMSRSVPGLRGVSGHLDGLEETDAAQRAKQLGSLDRRIGAQQDSAPQMLIKPESKPESLDPPSKTLSRPASPSQVVSEHVTQSQTPKKSTCDAPDHQNQQEEGSHSGCQDDFLTLLSHVQWGHLTSDPCSPKDTTITYIDVNQLFRILAATPKDLLNDQFVLLNSLPGLRITSGHDPDEQRKLTDAPELGQLFNKFSGTQNPRTEEQRCSFPPKPQTLEVPDTLKPGPLGLSPAKAAMPGNRCISPPNGPISPDDDYFSLIHRIHSSRLQNHGNLEGRREGGRAESSGAKGRTEGGKEKWEKERTGRISWKTGEESERNRIGGQSREKSEGRAGCSRSREESEVGKTEDKKEKGGKGKDKERAEKKKGGKKEGKEKKRKRGGKKGQKD